MHACMQMHALQRGLQAAAQPQGAFPPHTHQLAGGGGGGGNGGCPAGTGGSALLDEVGGAALVAAQVGLDELLEEVGRQARLLQRAAWAVRSAAGEWVQQISGMCSWEVSMDQACLGDCSIGSCRQGVL